MRSLLAILALLFSLTASSAQTSSKTEESFWFIPKQMMSPVSCYPYLQLDRSLSANGYQVDGSYVSMVNTGSDTIAKHIMLIYKNRNNGNILILYTGPRELDDKNKLACILTEGTLEVLKEIPRKSSGPPSYSPKSTEQET